MIISAYITHKRSESFSDCQDRFSINGDTKSIALSDGMSQSIFQKYWAEILVNTFTSNPEWVPTIDSVRELSGLWRKRVNDQIEIQKKEGVPTWRAERNLIDGISAGATFLGIRFTGYNWVCDVLGDSCLIHISKNKIKSIFTSENGKNSFDNFPDFFDSNPTRDGKGKPMNFAGSLAIGDVLLMTSDPLSDFLLKNKNTKDEAFLVEQLTGIKSHIEFEEIVDRLRTKGMHNDDSTLIIIKPDESEDFTIVNSDDISKLITLESQSKKKTKSYSLNDPHQSELNSQYVLTKEDDTECFNLSKELIKNDWYQIFDKDFENSLQSCIYKHLKGWNLTKGQRMKRTNELKAEIGLLIQHTLRKANKKCQ